MNPNQQNGDPNRPGGDDKENEKKQPYQQPKEFASGRDDEKRQDAPGKK